MIEYDPGPAVGDDYAQCGFEEDYCTILLTPAQIALVDGLVGQAMAGVQDGPHKTFLADIRVALKNDRCV